MFTTENGPIGNRLAVSDCKLFQVVPGAETRLGLKRFRMKKLAALYGIAVLAASVFLAPGDASADLCQIGASMGDATALPNTGISAVIEVVPLNGGHYYWIGERTTALFWGQVGYVDYVDGSLRPFFQVWDLNTGQLVVSSSFKKKISAGSHTFTMELTRGTKWSFSVDNTTLGTVDMHSSVSGDPGSSIVSAIVETQAANCPAPPQAISFSQLNVMQDGAWVEVRNGYAASGSRSFGVAGNLQDSSIPPATVLVGGTTPVLPAGTQLWQ
jgi:hypothetical protein